MGIAPVRASSLASHLLWFDEAGIRSEGIVRLPEILERVQVGTIDPKTEGTVGLERNGTALFDAKHGVPLLALTRAGGIATEKARDAGIGLVSVRDLGTISSTAGIAAEIAIGPTIGLILGPNLTWSIALPSPEGLPAVFDSALGSSATGREVLSQIAPWDSILAPHEGWMVLAIAVSSIEPLNAFHGRVATAVAGITETPGQLLPAIWNERRHDARTRGIPIAPAGWASLNSWAERLGIKPPSPVQG